MRVVVIGGGPAGLSAAIESAQTTSVVLLERGDQLGGSARYSAAITAVPGPDGPGALPPDYAQRVHEDVIAWTAAIGLPWKPAENPLDDGLTLRAPLGGGPALARVLEQTARRRGVQIRMGVTATGLERTDGWRVSLASGDAVDADRVVVATGGFSGSLDRVRRTLGGSGPLLRGAAEWADGTGGDWVEAVGGTTTRPGRVLLYGHGVPDPDDPGRALMIVAAPGARWLDGAGQPMVAPAVRGDGGRKLWDGPKGQGWVVLDTPSLTTLELIDPLGSGPLDTPGLIQRAGWQGAAPEDLASQTGLPLETFGALRCPCAALPVLPTTAKSLSGVVTDHAGQVLDAGGSPIPGLFAAGEVAGFGADTHPGIDSTMIAGAILSGRITGRSAAAPR